MAAMTPMKRKLSTTRGSKKSRYTKLIPIVTEALAETESLPANVRTLLKNALPIVLAIDKADRHAYEAEVVGQAQQALGQVQATMEQKHASALTAQNAVIAPAEEARRHTAKRTAEANLEAVKVKLEGDKASKKAAEKVEGDAEDALKVAQKEEKAADKVCQGHVHKLNHLNNCLTNDFQVALQEGAGAANTKAVQELLSIGRSCHLDSTLLQVLPMASKKQLATRTEFENLVFTSLEALLQREIATLSQTVAEAESAKAAKSGDVAGAQDALTKAVAALGTASDELTATNAAYKHATKEVSAAETHVHKIWDDMKVVCDAQDELAGDLQNLKEHVWAAFNQLKEKEPEPEEPEPVEEAAPVAEDAPMETAA